ncbi:membrane protein insertase YidC [Acidomonas methanolica]|uniref:Membrane protein insertase YidC n=2 Tax=Acidomonas methanolica TaxID=437 RepID=A0A023D0I5_ACIMT|nr:membrane protein insertase YidC [Acidomonas methanolica]MBU2653896.1 membrane protein insertase YidC [Acidomonas methanolica]TCS30856.1 YidC/Oxa1 family membrane protein insertase [Acidomonas methanolica]GAJ27579.1 translocase inner membrane component YidC [Acidomonas methanolica NBRC 104435]GEK98347.1 membrane protein insertase YidC [Acidomonas methanolica NBRC 104435]
MEIKRIILATVISALILLGFDYFVPQHPKDADKAAQKIEQAQTPAGVPGPGAPADVAAAAPTSPEMRIPIRDPDTTGSIDLRGARLDDLVLTKYHETLAKDSPFVRLLEKRDGPQPSFVTFGWLNAAGAALRLPDATTDWTAEGDALSPGHPVTLRWDNGQGLVFSIRIAFDRNYLFDVTQSVENKSGRQVSLIPYQAVERDYLPADAGSTFLEIVHQGPLSVMNDRLYEDSYKSMRKGGAMPGGQSWGANGDGGWGGITDKYWLTAVVADAASPVSLHYLYTPEGGYRVEFTAQAPLPVANDATLTTPSRVFAGAKEVELLDTYTNELHIPAFYKAVDFGWFAFLTRPMFHVLHWLYGILGNFGLALMALTLIVKLILYPLATKSFSSMAKMRTLQPRVQALREANKGDPMAMNQQMMALYREEGVNPAGGCLPLLIQAPVAFCLYKVLNITIEMRHAPFFGWIHDLSAPDPTNIFTLFGLIPWDPTTLSPLLHIGIWPILFGGTIWLMQRQSTVSLDPAQARVMQFMPLFYVFFLGRLSAGIVVYYTWNNVLTALQQHVIQRRANALATSGRKVAARKS